MQLEDLPRIRLASQHLANGKLHTISEITAWMGALQAQEFQMLKWALGVRLPGAALADFDAAYNTGEIIRTHLLRPTWHLVAAADLRWILTLTAPRIRQWLDGRHREQGMDPATVSRANTVIETAVGNGDALTRDELVARLAAAGIRLDENRAAHLLIGAELEGILCSGPLRAGKITYTHLESRLPPAAPIPREQALALLAARYFASHGPATLADFAWWSGLTNTDARFALEQVPSGLEHTAIAGEQYWFAAPPAGQAAEAAALILLPAYDEYIIAYAGRTTVLPAPHFSKAVSNNGIFRPVILIAGQVAGIWKRTFKKERILVETMFFTAPGSEIEMQIETAARSLGAFLGLQADVRHGVWKD